MNFDEVIAHNPPRLVVMFKLSDSGEELFQWGIVGNVPILTLIGNISRAQQMLAKGEWIQECEPSAFVMVWEPQEVEMEYFIHPNVPTMSMAGMLETIKFALVSGRLAQQKVSQRTQIVGPDGSPFPK